MTIIIKSFEKVIDMQIYVYLEKNFKSDTLCL